MKIFIFLGSLLISSAGIAEIRYVNDTIHILLRGGPGSEYQILHKGLASGTILEMLDVEPVEGYLKVKLKDKNMEGWVLSQYLTEQPIAKIRLETIEKKYNELNSKHKTVQLELDKINKAHKELTEESENKKSENIQLKLELEEITQISADSINIHRQNETFKITLNNTEQELEQLSTKISRLENNRELDWFIYGAITVSIGFIFGAVLPLFGRSRKKSEWT